MIQTTSNIALSKKTFYGIGGPADEFIEVFDGMELPEIWAETIAHKIPFCILGRGSNFVFSDQGFRGRVFVPKFEKIIQKKQAQKTVFTVESGCDFQKFIEKTNQAGFGDLNNLSGIPGNVGGFVRGNAGAYGSETGDFIVGIEYLDASGNRQKVSHTQANFVYRGSLFKQNPNYFILNATFVCEKQMPPEAAQEESQNLLKTRWKKYPKGRSGGCVFKNPNPEKNIFAGKILDEMGAKGDFLGDIIISREHANFFVNQGYGRQKDLLALISKWQKKVQAEKNIWLEPEIFVMDEWGKSVFKETKNSHYQKI